jgi:hypothetical protein
MCGVQGLTLGAWEFDRVEQGRHCGAQAGIIDRALVGLCIGEWASLCIA